MSGFRFTLTKKAVFASALILLPILLAFFTGFVKNRDLLKRHFLDDLTMLAESFEAQTYQFLELSKNRAIDFSTDALVLSELQRNQGGLKSSAALEKHLKSNKLPIDGQIRAAIVISASGRIIASTDPALSGADFSREALFTSARDRVSVTQRREGPAGMPELIVSAPVISKEGEFLGLVSIFIPLSKLDAVLHGDAAMRAGAFFTGMGRKKTFEAYIVNNEGLMLTSSRFVEDAILKLKVDTEPVRACLDEGKTLSGFYPDYRGMEVAGASMCLPPLGWTLVVEIDSDEALVPVVFMGRGAAITAVIVASLITLMLILFYRSVVVQLKALSGAARRIAGGEYGTAVPVRSNDEIGALSNCFNSMAREIEERNASLRLSEARLKKAQSIAHMGCWEWDIKKNALWWSDEIYGIFGLASTEFGATYESFMNAVHLDDREFVDASVRKAFFDGKPYSIDHRIVLPDGSERVVHEEAEVIRDQSGNPVRMTGTVQDVTAMKQAEFELKKLSMIIEHSVNLVFITDAKGTIQYVNPVFVETTGYSKDEAIGQNPRILASGDVTNAQYQELWKTITAGKTWRSTFRNKKKTGGYYWANSVITPIRNERGEITNFLAVQEDVTGKMVSEERVSYLAKHDELTGLVNRSRFIELVDEWISAAGPRGLKGMLAIFDMDQFKLLNDTFGHGAGDEYLRRITRVLGGSLAGLNGLVPSPFDQDPVLCRLSGDEFAVLLSGVAEQEGLAVVEALRKAVEEFYFTDASSSMTISAGVVFFPGHAITSQELLTKADAAMYRAKELGRNRVHEYRPEDHDLEKMHSRLSWKEKILKGLKEDRFVPWFQPILDLNTGTVHHYEALARLVAEDGTVLLPGAFIDIAERFGIIGLIDRAIIEKSMRAQADMSKKGFDISFGMNLSGKDLGDQDMLEFIKTRITETGADPRRLVFEITETAAIGDLDKATRFMGVLKELGCQFALDDFGVGFTSFTYLKEMQVDYIKIDGSFIKKLHENPNDQVFVRAITDVAKGLNIKSIAEFVENEKTLGLLESFGVDFAQGYLVGKPAPDLALAGQFPDFKKKAAASIR